MILILSDVTWAKPNRHLFFRSFVAYTLLREIQRIYTYLSGKTPAFTDDSRFNFWRWNFSKSSPPPLPPASLLFIGWTMLLKLIEQIEIKNFYAVFFLLKQSFLFVFCHSWDCEWLTYVCDFIFFFIFSCDKDV